MGVPDPTAGLPFGPSTTSGGTSVSLPFGPGGSDSSGGGNGGVGGGGGWSWNPLQDIQHGFASAYNYWSPVKSIRTLGEGVYGMLGAPVVNDIMAVGDLSAAALAGGANSLGWKQPVSGNEYLNRAGQEAHGALAGLEGLPTGLLQIGEGITSDAAHLTPFRNQSDQIIQKINQTLGQAPWEGKVQDQLLGPDRKGMKPQDFEAIARHSGALTALVMQAGLASEVAGGVEAYAGGAADAADTASTVGAANDPATASATVGAQDAAQAQAEQNAPGFDWRRPWTTGAETLGANKDFSNLSPEDAMKAADRYRQIADAASKVHHIWGFAGQQVASLFQAQKLHMLDNATATDSPPTVPTDATPEGIDAAVSQLDPVAAGAEGMAASHAAAVANGPYDHLNALANEAAAAVQPEVIQPPEPGMVRLSRVGDPNGTFYNEGAPNPSRATGTSLADLNRRSFVDVPQSVVDQMKQQGMVGPNGEIDLSKAVDAGMIDKLPNPTEVSPQGGTAVTPGTPEAPASLDQINAKLAEQKGTPTEGTPEYQPKEGPKLKIGQSSVVPDVTPSGNEDALAELERLHQQAAAEHPVPEAMDALGRKIAMPPPRWATQLAENTPDWMNKTLGRMGGKWVDKFRQAEAQKIMDQAMRTAQNRALTSPLMNAGRAAAVDVITGTFDKVTRPQALQMAGEDIGAAVTGDALAANFVNNEGWNPLETSVGAEAGQYRVIPPIAADVRAALMDKARNGFTGLPQDLRDQMSPEQQAQYDAHIRAAVDGYKIAMKETLSALLATRFGAHGFESAILNDNNPMMSPGDQATYRRLMSDLRREQVYRSRIPTLVDAAKAALDRQLGLGDKQNALVEFAQRRLGLTLRTVEDMHQGVPPGIRPENIDGTIGTTLQGAAAVEQATGTYAVTITPQTGAIFTHDTGFNVEVAPQFDIPWEQWANDPHAVLKDTLEHPKALDGSTTMSAAQIWGSGDNNLTIHRYTAIDGTQRVSGTISMDTIGGMPLNIVQAHIIGEAYQQTDIWDNSSGKSIRMSNDPNAQNLFAQYVSTNAPEGARILDPNSTINKYIDAQLETLRALRQDIAQPVGASRIVPSDEAVAQTMKGLMHIDSEMAKVPGSPYKLGDMFNVDVRPGVNAPRSPSLFQTSMPFDMTTKAGIEMAFNRYDAATVDKFMSWYHESHGIVEDAFRGQSFPGTARDAADVFYDVFALASVMASPTQNLGRALMLFANFDEMLSEHPDQQAFDAAKSVMDRAMKLPPDVVYVQNIGKGAEATAAAPGEPYYGTESFPKNPEAQQVVGRGKGTAVPVRYFETPEWRKLTESTSMMTGPKYALIDVLMGRLNLQDATNEEIAQQAGNWTKPKELSDANLPPGRIRYWAAQMGIQSPALQHLTELEQQVEDLKAQRDRGVPPQTTPFISDQAKAYAKEAGLPAPKPTDVSVQANPVRGRVVADWYKNAENNPTDPKVVAAYAAFASDVGKQWDFLKRQGVNVEFVDRPETGGMYPDAAAMIHDVQDNHHLYVDRTGPGEEHLMPGMNAVIDHTADGTPVTMNDAFRAVHDYFGHAQAGNDFSRHGEEVAWQLHRSMFSKAAQPALFTETVGQNSFLNFAPENYAKRAAGGTAEFPEQKAILPPDKYLKPSYLPGVREAQQALRDTMRDPTLAPAYEQAMMEHGGQSSWAKMRSFRANLSDPVNSLAVTQDSVMAQFYGMRATDWNLKRYPGTDTPPEAGSVWADKSDEVRNEAVALAHKLDRPVPPNNIQALLWVLTKEFIGTQDWGRLVGHRDAAQAEFDTLEQTLKAGGTIDASTVHPLASWWDEELAAGKAYSMLQDERARLEDRVKAGEILPPADRARLDELQVIPHKATDIVKVDVNANDRADLQDTANSMLNEETRYQVLDASEYRAKEAQFKKYQTEVEAPIQAALARGDVGTARSILDEYVAKWEKPIKGDAEGGNVRDVAIKQMDPNAPANSTRSSVERLAAAKHVPSPLAPELTLGELHDTFDNQIRGSLTAEPTQTGRLLMRLYHGGDYSTLLHEGMHLVRLMSPGDVVAQLQEFLPNIQDQPLTAARVADEEKFVGWLMTYLHTGVATGNVPPALEPMFTNIARIMDRTYGPVLNMPGMENVPQPIVDHFDNIFNPQIVRPNQLIDPVGVNALDKPPTINPVQRPWESDYQFSQRARQLGEARVQSTADAAKLRGAQATLAKINAAADEMAKLVPLGGEAGVALTAKADALATGVTSGLDKLAEKLDNAEGRNVPKVWRSILQGFQGVAEMAKADETGQLAEHLGEIPRNLRQVMQYAAERGFEPTYLPDITWQMAAKHLFGHLSLSSSLEEAGLRSENRNVLSEQGNNTRTLNALAAAQTIAMKELYQDQLVAHIEKYYAEPHTPGDPIPNGYKAWDAVRKGIILGRNRMGDVTAVNATSIVPEGVDAAIKAMSRDYSSWPFRFLFKGQGPTSVWKQLLMTYSPSWYVKHFTGTVALAALEGVQLRDWNTAFHQAIKQDEFGYRWADIPDVVRRNSVNQAVLGEQGGNVPGLSLRDIARNEGMRSAIVELHNRLHNVVNTVDALGRAAVYAKTLREGGSPDLAATRAAEATGNYMSLGPFEREAVSAVMPFYAFQKAMFQILIRLPLEHPLAAALFMNMGQMNIAEMERKLGGPMPDQLIGAEFGANGQLQNFAKVNPLVDAYKLVTPEGIAQSVNPIISLIAEQVFGAPSYNGTATQGSYGQLQMEPNWVQTLADSITSSPVGIGTTGVAQGDLASIADALVPRLGRTWSDKQYQQLLKRIAKTQADLKKLNQPGAYLGNPSVNVPAQTSPGGGTGLPFP